MKLEIFQITMIFGGSQVPREVQAKSSSQKITQEVPFKNPPWDVHPRDPQGSFEENCPVFKHPQEDLSKIRPHRFGGEGVLIGGQQQH